MSHYCHRRLAAHGPWEAFYKTNLAGTLLKMLIQRNRLLCLPALDHCPQDVWMPQSRCVTMHSTPPRITPSRRPHPSLQPSLAGSANGKEGLCTAFRKDEFNVHRLFLLALMAAIIFLAANFEAFRYMNQFPLFRTIRNYVIFFLMLLGRMAASAFATVTGQEQKPRIEQIHQATVLVVEIFTATLLVSTLSSIFDVVTSMIARKNLQKLKIEVQDIDRSFGDLRLLYCPNLIGLDECEREPCKNVYDAVKCLDKFDVFKAPRAAKDEASQLAAEDAYSENLTLIEEQAKALLELVVGDVKKESNLINRIKIAVSSINQLLNRFSVFTRDPEISEDLKKSVQEAGIIHTRLHVFSILLNIYCGALAEFNKISLVRRRSAQDKLDAAVRAVEYFNLQAEQQMKKTERKIVPRKNILANVVIICLLVSSGYIAWKHSQTSTTTRKSSSPSTQMALLENYFQTSEFSSSFTILGLQIVGVYLAVTYLVGF